MFLAAGLAVLMLLSACAARPTPYQSRDGAFGYAQTQIDSQTWRVDFAGNVDTPRGTVENYLLYRSAEIMLFGGHERFIVLEKEVERTRDYRSTGPYPYHFGYRGRRHAHGLHHHGHGARQTYALDSYRAFATIRVYSGGSPPAGLPVYAARDLIARLGPSVVLPR